MKRKRSQSNLKVFEHGALRDVYASMSGVQLVLVTAILLAFQDPQNLPWEYPRSFLQSSLGTP